MQPIFKTMDFAQRQAAAFTLVTRQHHAPTGCAEIDGDTSAKEGTAIKYDDVLSHINMTVSQDGKVLATNKNASLFDQLDAGRVEQLIRLVSEDSFGQILITDCNPTRLRTILDKAGGEYALFTVGNGAVTQGNATATAAAADPDKGSAGSRPGNAVTDGAAEPMEEKTPGQTGTAAADRTEGQAGESPAGEPARRPSEPVPAPEPAEEPAAEPDGNGARPGDAASEGGRP